MSVLAIELAKHFEEVEPLDFYREIFPDGVLDVQRERGTYHGNHKYMGIGLEITNDKVEKFNERTGKTYFTNKVLKHIVTDDLDGIELMQHSKNFCFMSPISYVGKNPTRENSRMLHALTIEIDNLCAGKVQSGIQNLIEGMDGGIRDEKNAKGVVFIYPRPTFIVASGNGVHLYYVFEEPIPLYPNVQQSLTAYKNRMTKRLWNKWVTDDYKPEKIQYESIWQGFRVVGTRTKLGIEKDVPDLCRAYRVGDTVSIEYMNNWMEEEKNKIKIQYQSKGLNLEKAKEKWPEWYEERIVRKQPKRMWPVNRALYDWWKRRITTELQEGGTRYNCMRMLVAYGVKCSKYDPEKNPHPVTYEEVESDCMEIMEFFDNLPHERKDGERDPFTIYDVECALDYWHPLSYTNTIEYIQLRSGLAIEKNKRRAKPLTRDDGTAFKAARMIQELQDPDGNWRNKEGRPCGSGTKEAVIKAYIKEHPEQSVTEIARALKVSRTTVYKYTQPEEVKMRDVTSGYTMLLPDGSSVVVEKRMFEKELKDEQVKRVRAYMEKLQ